MDANKGCSSRCAAKLMHACPRAFAHAVPTACDSIPLARGALVVTLCQVLGWALGHTDESDSV